MTVHFRTDLVTSAQIKLGGGPRAVTWNVHAKCRPLHGREWLSDHESQSCVERERAVVIRGLKQPYSREGLLLYSVEGILHKLTPDRTILHRGINRDWAEASYGRTLVDEVTADDRAVEFGDHRIEARVSKQPSQQPTRDFLRRKIWREIVLLGDCLKGVVTDL